MTNLSEAFELRKRLRLSKQEWALFTLLLTQRTVRAETIISAFWCVIPDNPGNTINKTLSTLRKKTGLRIENTRRECWFIPQREREAALAGYLEETETFIPYKPELK